MKKLAKGFTLIELMIVVAIIGILAAIAIPNFVKYQLRTKFSEGATNLEGLRKAEEALRQGERKITVSGAVVATYKPGTYWDLGAAAIPGTAPDSQKVAWVSGELATAAGLDWQVEGATYFQYQVSVANCVVTGAANSGTCYYGGASSDIDADTVKGEVALVKDSLQGVRATKPGNIATAFPGTLGSCLIGTQSVVGSPCTLTGPDVF